MPFLLPVTLVSLLLAVAMTVVAWRAAREERRRSQARVTALAADIQAALAAPAVGLRPEPRLRAVAQAERPSGDLFAAQPSAASSRSLVIVGVGLFAFATAAALTVALTSATRASTAEPLVARAQHQPSAPAAANPAVPAPLELVALGHQRDGDRLIVRGVIRNPSSGTSTDRLTAVVFVFDRDGGFITSGRATIDPEALPPGGESTFVVSVPGAGDVSRYRVSFRSESGIVQHVDRRTRS